MNFLLKHILHLHRKSLKCSHSTGKFANLCQINDYSKNCPKNEKVNFNFGQNKPILPRTLSFCCGKKYERPDINTWTIEDETRFNVEKQILEAKHQAKTVSIIDNELYIDYQFVCEVPSSLQM